jgi:hypothetical protein
MDVLKLFREWQRELRLADWNIQFAVRSSLEMGSDHGRARVYPLKKCAHIAIRDPQEPLDTSEVEPYDPEVVIVHELLHCALHAFEGEIGSTEDLCQEQMIHVQSTLLVGQKRKICALEAKLKRQRVARVLPVAA